MTPTEALRRLVVDKEYRTQDHPAANGRQPQHGEQAWTFIFPLEDGTKLRVQTGKKSRAALLNMANQEAADDAIEAALGAGGRRCDLPGCDVDYGVTCQHSQEVIITDLRARLAAVEVERNEIQMAWNREVVKRTALATALARYGRHEFNACDAWLWHNSLDGSGYYPTGKPCTCGFDQAREGRV